MFDQSADYPEATDRQSDMEKLAFALRFVERCNERKISNKERIRF